MTQAEWGRGSLTEDLPRPQDDAGPEAQPPLVLRAFRRTGSVIPGDVREQLRAEVESLTKVVPNLDHGRRQNVVNAVVSLAHLLPRDVWNVDNRDAPTRALAAALAEYNRLG